MFDFNQKTTPDWFDLVPKLELHIHLEGAIPLSILWQLVQKYGGDPAVPDERALREKFTYVDFPHFIETWIWKNQFLREYDDFTLIAEAVAREQARQNIRYTEAFYSPPDFARHGIRTLELTEAIRKGLAKVPEVEVALVADLVRDFGPDKAAVTLAEVQEVRDLGVIGIGIGGSEQNFPPEQFEQVFKNARDMGFRTSAHAGEASGAASIRGAIDYLQVDRIGHGTRAKEDPALVKYLAERQIPLEVCPSSNICTGAVGTFRDHPVREYMKAGLMITINTDDPVMFNTNLAREFRLLASEFDLGREDIRNLILQAIESSWMSLERKQILRSEFQSDPAWR
ncbi:MAG: adenosine deaminase [Candidatus Marinimicrobia bacterium]|nr:adenosine deaminase [Candidatus Neomarinimicrobiota bacterium]